MPGSETFDRVVRVKALNWGEAKFWLVVLVELPLNVGAKLQEYEEAKWEEFVELTRESSQTTNDQWTNRVGALESSSINQFEYVYRIARALLANQVRALSISRNLCVLLWSLTEVTMEILPFDTAEAVIVCS